MPLLTGKNVVVIGLRFVTLAPRIIPDTELGKHAVAGCSRDLGISAADFIRGMVSPPAPSDVAAAVVDLAANSQPSKGNVLIVTCRTPTCAPS